VSGEPNAVILPLFVKADDGRTSAEIPIPNAINAIVRNNVKRDLDADWGIDLDIRLSSRCDGLRRCAFLLSNSGGNGNRLKWLFSKFLALAKLFS
jgi:hypothetical protein